MKIHPPELTVKEKGRVRVQSLIESSEGKKTLWYEMDERYRDYLILDRLDAFVVGLVCQAMRTGEDIEAEGAISARLSRNLNYYMHIKQKLYPQWHVIRVEAKHQDNLMTAPRGPGIGTGLSNGVDSFCTLYDHFLNGTEGNRVNYLLNMNVGSHGRGEEGAWLFRKRLGPVQEVADRLGLELIAIDSNLDSFYKDQYSDSHAPRIASCVLLLQKLFSTYYFASTFGYLDLVPSGTTAVADHMLSTEVLEVVPDGAQYNRIEKMQRILDWKLPQAYLNVCTNDPTGRVNCSSCKKCVGAMVVLDMLGATQKYKHLFDFSDLKQKRDRWVEEMSEIVCDFNRSMQHMR